jgi:small subunit ribosomal protein S2
MAVVTMRQLLEAGVHFGHQTRRWNPKMKRFIFGERNGIYIIDLNQTLQRVDVAYSFVRDLVANGGSVLFIGTKKQSQDPIARSAQQCGMPYVNERWLGGMLTNFSTIAQRVKKMQEYERMRGAGDFEAMPKKEALILSRELEKLERNLGGIRDMARLPDAVFIIDIKKEHIAVSEANKMGIPIVAVVDTNCDPDLVQYPIPGNDDAIRSGTLMCRVIQEAVQEGQFVASRRGTVTGPAAGGPALHVFEPLGTPGTVAAQAFEPALATTGPATPGGPAPLTQPAPAQPAPAQPVPAQPAPATPAPVPPAPVEPAPAQPAPAQAVPTQAAPSAPAVPPAPAAPPAPPALAGPPPAPTPQAEVPATHRPAPDVEDQSMATTPAAAPTPPSTSPDAPAGAGLTAETTSEVAATPEN